MNKIQKEIERNRDLIKSRNERWKNRRRMAYISLFSVIATTLLCMFVVSTDRLPALSEIIIWFFIIMGSIVGAYVGFSSLEEKWSKKVNGKE